MSEQLCFIWCWASSPVGRPLDEAHHHPLVHGKSQTASCFLAGQPGTYCYPGGRIHTDHRLNHSGGRCCWSVISSACQWKLGQLSKTEIWLDIEWNRRTAPHTHTHTEYSTLFLMTQWKETLRFHNSQSYKYSLTWPRITFISCIVQT